MTEFKDVGKAAKDLFKKPFNAGKLDVDVKCGAFTLKNASKGDTFASTLEKKYCDIFFGNIEGCVLPCKSTFNGKALVCEMTKAVKMCGDSNVDLELKTEVGIDSGITGCNLKSKLVSNCGLVGVIDTPLCSLGKTTFNATYPVKSFTLGVAGSLSDPTALSYAIQHSGISLETDLSTFSLNIFDKIDGDTAIACRADWVCGDSSSSFGFATKRRLKCGANLHVKGDISGAIDIAHVSDISEGVKLTMSTNFNALKMGAPTFGAGFEFNL